MPGWVEEGFADYAKRMPRELPLELLAVKAEPRSEGKTVEAMMGTEAQRLRAALPNRCRTIALDERGTELTTQNLALRLQRWMQEGDDTALARMGSTPRSSARQPNKCDSPASRCRMRWCA